MSRIIILCYMIYHFWRKHVLDKKCEVRRVIPPGPSRRAAPQRRTRAPASPAPRRSARTLAPRAAPRAQTPAPAISFVSLSLSLYPFIYIYIYMCSYIHVYNTIFRFVYYIYVLVKYSSSCQSDLMTRRLWATYRHLYINIYIYIYIYIYMGGALSPPPLLFDHPAIYKNSWRAGETIALVYNYAKTHTITHVYCRRETLGIIFPTLPTFPTFCKESLGFIFPTFPTFPK